MRVTYPIIIMLCNLPDICELFHIISIKFQLTQFLFPFWNFNKHMVAANIKIKIRITQIENIKKAWDVKGK